MAKVDTLTLLQKELNDSEKKYEDSNKAQWRTDSYNSTKARLTQEIEEELAEPSYFEYKSSKDKIYVKVVRKGRGIDRKFTLNLSSFLADCDNFCQLDTEEFYCYILGQLQNHTMGIREYRGKDNPKNIDDFKAWEKHTSALIQFAVKRFKSLLK